MDSEQIVGSRNASWISMARALMILQRVARGLRGFQTSAPALAKIEAVSGIFQNFDGTVVLP